MRPGQEEERGVRERGPGFSRDESGREFREERGTKVYRTQEDRDEALDASFDLSGPIRLVLGVGHEEQPRGVVSLAMSNSPDLAELFWREAAQIPQQGVRDKLLDWEIRHFGRALPLAPHGTLAFEVRCKEAHASKRYKTIAQFKSYAEQQRYERAAGTVAAYDEDGNNAAEKHARAIVAAAEGRPFGEVFAGMVDALAEKKRMHFGPSKREWEKRSNEEKARIAARAAAERRDPCKDSPDAEAPVLSIPQKTANRDGSDIDWLEADLQGKGEL